MSRLRSSSKTQNHYLGHRMIAGFYGGLQRAVGRVSRHRFSVGYGRRKHEKAWYFY